MGNFCCDIEISTKTHQIYQTMCEVNIVTYFLDVYMGQFDVASNECFKLVSNKDACRFSRMD